MQALRLSLVALLIAVPTEAQFIDRFLGGPPEIEVSLEHPPRLNLSVERVAFGKATGDCAEELVDSLISMFVNQGVEVIDRLHVEALLDEHEFSTSGVVDRHGVAVLGRILGPAALVFVKSRRCTTEQQRLVGKQPILAGRNPPLVSRTTAYFKGSIQVIDLSTARIHSAKAIDETIKAENEAYDYQPEFPSTYDTLDRALARAASRVRQMFFPWTERKRLRFYDTKDCGLKLAYNFVQAGDYAAALDQSRRNVEGCEGFRVKKPKLVANAYYNLGMASFLVGVHDDALGHFEESLRLKPHQITSSAMNECRRARQAVAEMARYEEAVSLGERPDFRATSSEAARTGTTETTESRETNDGSIEERLAKLKGLFDKRLISEAEYETKRGEILAEL